MDKDERDLLEVLKFELEFLEKGGYGRSPREPSKCVYFFKDSPACMNYDAMDNPGPHSDCVLMRLVPPEFRDAEMPCWHIPLNAEGETLDSLFRYAEQHEIEEKYGEWLRGTIAKIEEMRSILLGTPVRSPIPGPHELHGEPLLQKLHPKCANPACPNAFHWLNGGKLFRFRPDSSEAPSGGEASACSLGAHGMRHYWLCEPCSLVFTLVYDENQGVVLKLLRPELPTGEPVSESRTA